MDRRDGSDAHHRWLPWKPIFNWLLVAVGVGIAAMASVMVAVSAKQAPASTSTSPAQTPAPSATDTAAQHTGVSPPESATLMASFDDGNMATDTGQEWTQTGSNPMVAIDGGMTVNGIGTGYATVDLGAAPATLGASVVFDPGSAHSVAALIVSKGPGLDLGNMGVHYFFGVNGWQLQVREGGEMPFPSLMSGSFEVPLVADSRTVHNVEIRVDGDTVTIRQADGSVDTVSDPRVSANSSGNVAWEVWHQAEDEARPIFKKLWARLDG